MKINVKKIVSVLMALLILFAPLLSVGTASAAGDGSITVTGATKDKNYSIYRIFDLQYQGQKADNSLKVVYKMSAEWKPFFTTGAGRAYIVDTNTGNNLNPIDVDGVTKYINITEANIAEFAKVAMAEIHKVGIRQEAKKLATGNTVTFENIPLGYYLVHPEGSTDKLAGQNSIVSLTSTVPDGTVVAKATYPTVDKTVNKVSADFGEELTYTLVSNVPDTTGFDVYTYKMTDKLSDGLDIKANSVQVYIDGAEVANNKASGALTTPNVTITTATTRQLVVNFNMKEYQAKVGTEVKVVYKASLNQNAVIGVNGNPNVVELEYSNDPKNNDSRDKTTDKEKVHTAAIKVLKHEKGNERKVLSGAKFVLKNATGQYYKLDNDTVKWVTVANEAELKQKITAGEIDEKTTPDNGVVEFKGLKNGTYYLHETEAPVGYNKLNQDVEVQIDFNNQTTTQYQEVKVPNSTGVELPGTGGSGTLLFLLVGGGLVLFAGSSLLKGRK